MQDERELDKFIPLPSGNEYIFEDLDVKNMLVDINATNGQYEIDVS